MSPGRPGSAPRPERIRRNKAGTAAAWIAADAVVSSAASLAGTLFAAKLIGPASVGLASIALTILQLANFIAGALFADAIVQRDHLRAPELGGAFRFLVIVSAALALLVVSSANLWARLYGEQEVATLLRAGSLAILCTGLSAIQAAMLRRHLRFHILAMSGMVSRTAASIICVLAAVRGFGAWSLIVQYLAAIMLDALIVMVAAPLRWRLRVPVTAVRPLLPFALAETSSQFVVANQPRFFLMLVAYFLPLSAVGEINLAFRIVDSLRGVIASAAGRLCVAIFSRSQARPDKLRQLFVEATKFITGFTFPAFAALAVSAPEIVGVTFGEQWVGAGPQLQVLSLVAMLFFLRSAGGFLLTSTARPRISLAIASCSLGMMVLGILAYPPHSAIWAMAYWASPLAVVNLADIFIIRAIFGISIMTQLVAVLPGLSAAAVMAIALEAVRLGAAATGLGSPALLLCEIAVGSAIAVPILAVLLRPRGRNVAL